MSVEGLGKALRQKPGARHVIGTVLAAVDATHATVDLGSRVVTAVSPAGMGAPVGARVRVCQEANAHTITAVLADSGRVTFTTSPAGSGWYERIGRRVDVQFQTTSSVSSGGTSTITTLPEGFRPAQRVAMACAGGAIGDRLINGSVNTDGTIKVRNNDTASYDVNGYVSFLLA